MVDQEISARPSPPWLAVYILGFVGFVTSFGAHIVAVNLPVYARQVGVGLAVIGLLISAYDLAEIVAKPVFGALADRHGARRTMLLGIALFSLASLLYLALPPQLLLVVRFLQGLGAAALSAISLALVGLYYPQRRGRAFGIYNTIKGAGYVLSPVIGGAILAGFDFAALFVAAFAVGALAFVLALFLPPPTSDEGIRLDEDDDATSPSGLLNVFRDPGLRPWFLTIVVNMFFVGILFGFLPVHVHRLGYSPLLTGGILAVASGSYLLVQPIAGLLADRSGPGRTVVIGLVVSAVATIVLSFTQGPLLVPVSILAGGGIGTVWTNTDAVVSNLARHGQMGVSMGAAGSFKELGDMLGPLLIGVLSQALGLEAGFVICGLLGLLALLFLRRGTLSAAVVPPLGR